jgi:polyisoprenyl-phosphate glycosyltransferase
MLVFRLLTGARIDFGNFCLIPREKVESLISNSSIWNNLTATLTRSPIPLAGLPSDRGARYAGKFKKMLGALALSALTLLGILAVAAVRFLTSIAIPGWAAGHHPSPAF